MPGVSFKAVLTRISDQASNTRGTEAMSSRHPALISADLRERPKSLELPEQC
jgi:hypothetical protein